MADGGADFDPEAFQAQMDLSMSLMQNMVSSWVPPSYKASAASKDTDKELEEYLRRPPRLGVGAIPPESSGVTARETARLKNKLTMNGKKRGRENKEETGSRASEDEGGERGAKSVKKARVDPFSSGGKKKKKREKDGQDNLNGKEDESPVVLPVKVDRPLDRAAEDAAKAGEAAATHSEAAVVKAADVTALDALPTESTLLLTPQPLDTPKKKKKKRRRKSNAILNSLPFDGSVPNTQTSPYHTLSSAVAPTDAATDKNDETLTVISSIIKAIETLAPIRPSPEDDRHRPTEQSIAVNGTNKPSLPQTSQVGPVQRLLNLDGPPPDFEGDTVDDAAGQSPKKKRKKKKKKKKHPENDEAGP